MVAEDEKFLGGNPGSKHVLAQPTVGALTFMITETVTMSYE